MKQARKYQRAIVEVQGRSLGNSASDYIYFHFDVASGVVGKNYLSQRLFKIPRTSWSRLETNDVIVAAKADGCVMWGGRWTNYKRKYSVRGKKKKRRCDTWVFPVSLSSLALQNNLKTWSLYTNIKEGSLRALLKKHIII